MGLFSNKVIALAPEESCLRNVECQGALSQCAFLPGSCPEEPAQLAPKTCIRRRLDRHSEGTQCSKYRCNSRRPWRVHGIYYRTRSGDSPGNGRGEYCYSGHFVRMNQENIIVGPLSRIWWRRVMARFSSDGLSRRMPTFSGDTDAKGEPCGLCGGCDQSRDKLQISCVSKRGSRLGVLAGPR